LENFKYFIFKKKNEKIKYLLKEIKRNNKTND